MVERVGNDAALICPEVLTRLPVVGLLNHDAQMVQPLLRHSRWLEIILKQALGHRTVDTHVGAVPVGPTPHLVKHPRTRQRAPSGLALKENWDACGRTKSAAVDN